MITTRFIIMVKSAMKVYSEHETDVVIFKACCFFLSQNTDDETNLNINYHPHEAPKQSFLKYKRSKCLKSFKKYIRKKRYHFLFSINMDIHQHHILVSGR